MVEGEIPARFEDPASDGEHEIQIGVIPERGGGDADATSRGCAAASNPTATMQVNLVAPRRVDPHRLITVRWEEKMTVISGQHAMLDAGRGELADRSGQIVDDSIHHLASLEREPPLAGMVD